MMAPLKITFNRRHFPIVCFYRRRICAYSTIHRDSVGQRRGHYLRGELRSLKKKDRGGGVLFVRQINLAVFQTSFARSTALVPPKAKEFDIIVLTFMPILPSLGT